ncbi:MAG TPA: hypothetical protein VN871_18665 [Mycobacterium sp.]|nr:hypothetical protein [Mycobacterium sp.]
MRFLLEDPAFDVVGVWVKREQNIGRTAGELAGLAVDGPSATYAEGVDGNNTSSTPGPCFTPPSSSPYSAAALMVTAATASAWT